MTTITYTTARSHLSETMQQVCDDHVPIIITRAKYEPVVMISLSDYETMKETNYLMKSPANASRLVESIDEIEHLIKASKTKSKKK